MAGLIISKHNVESFLDGGNSVMKKNEFSHSFVFRNDSVHWSWKAPWASAFLKVDAHFEKLELLLQSKWLKCKKRLERNPQRLLAAAFRELNIMPHINSIIHALKVRYSKIALTVESSKSNSGRNRHLHLNSKTNCISVLTFVATVVLI